MRTMYVALMGADGARGYRPICRQAVTIEAEKSNSIYDIVRECRGGVRKVAARPILLSRDTKMCRAAWAWGYDEAWETGSGCVILVGSSRPRDMPDPDYAWWVGKGKPDASKYLKPPVAQAGDGKTEHKHKRSDGMTYTLENREKIKSRCADLLAERGIVSEETVRVVCNIMGSSFDTLNDILESETGEKDVMFYFADTLEAEGLVSREDEEEEEEE